MIHRGTHQIGGCVTALRTGTARIFLDLGSPLPGPGGTAPEETMSLPGVTVSGAPCQGVFFTHTHGDHIGQIGRVLPEVPLFLGAAARDVALTLYRRLARHPGTDSAAVLAALERAHAFRPGVPLTVGDIRLTPLLVDHSAFDAYMFLIEAEGVRILHTGDFRNHGPRGKALLPTLRRYVGQVDWLICEGTVLSRPDAPVLTELQLARRARAVMERYRHIFALCASTNIDRVSALAHCAPRRKPVVCDHYQKAVLDCVQRHSGEKSPFYRFDRVIPWSEGNQKLKRWVEDQGLLLFVRDNQWSRELMARYRENSVVLYSMWEGYLEGPQASPGLAELLADFPVIRLHTSGHAGRAALRALCRTVSPRRGIVPIHGEDPTAFRSLLPEAPVVCLEDGQALSL